MPNHESQLRREQEPPFHIEEHERFGARVRELVTKRDNWGDHVEDIEYTIEGENPFSLKTLLPEDWRFLRSWGDKMEADTARKRIIYGDHYLFIRDYTIPEGERMPEEVHTEAFAREVDRGRRIVRETTVVPQVMKKGFFLGMLHELGHAHIFEEMTPDKRKQYDEIENDPRIRFKPKSEFTSEEMKRYRDIVIKEERDAWAWVLRKLRALRREGVDLEPELKTRKDLLQGVHASVTTYEQDLDPDEIKKIWDLANYTKGK